MVMGSGSIGSGCWLGRRQRLAAAQALEAVEFETSQLQLQEAQAVPVRRRGLGIADQIGFATKCSPASASRRLADARALVAEMPATLQRLAAGRVSRAGCAGGDHRDAVSDPGGPWPGGRRIGAGGGDDVGPGDHAGGAAAGDRTRPGRRRPSGSTGSGGPVRVHPTAARHHGEDHRRAARWSRPWPVSHPARRRRNREGDRGRTDQSPDQGRHPRPTRSPARPPRPRSRWRSSW